MCEHRLLKSEVKVKGYREGWLGVARAEQPPRRQQLDGKRALGLGLSRSSFSVALCLFALGCAGRGKEASAPGRNAHVNVPTTVITKDTGENIADLLARADRAAEDGAYEEAIHLYHRVIDADLEGDYRTRAFIGLGTIHDVEGRAEAALAAYQSAVPTRGPSSRPEVGPLRVRIVRLLVFLERFVEAEEVARELDPSERPVLEAVIIHAARALGLVERGELDEAQLEIGRGRQRLDDAGLGQLIEVPLDVAALEYARGELLRRRAEAIGFDPLPLDFAAALEERCRYILDAQAAYSEVMKAGSAQYSAMAGVRVGSLYQSLHSDLIRMGRPTTADTPEKRMLFEAALRLRYAILLRKAAAMMESTVRMIERTGEGGQWADRARQALSEISQAERSEQALIDALPVARADIERALADLGERAK